MENTVTLAQAIHNLETSIIIAITFDNFKKYNHYIEIQISSKQKVITFIELFKEKFKFFRELINVQIHFFFNNVAFVLSSCLTLSDVIINEDGVLYGPLHSEQGVELYKQALLDAQAQGGKIEYGGKVYN